MTPQSFCRKPARFPLRTAAAFTLIELLVSLFLIMIILTIAAVSIEAVSDESRLRQPAAELKSFAKRAVKSAVAEQRSYSVFFHSKYFLLRETYPEQRVDEDDFALDLFRNSQGLPEEEGTVVVVRHDMAEDLALQVRRWNSEEWIVPEGVEWVFEPSGLCEPLSVRFTRRDGYVEIDFNPLTAGVQEERLYIP